MMNKEQLSKLTKGLDFSQEWFDGLDKMVEKLIEYTYSNPETQETKMIDTALDYLEESKALKRGIQEVMDEKTIPTSGKKST